MNKIMPVKDKSHQFEIDQFLKRELVKALKDAVGTATSGYRAGAQSVERWNLLIASVEATL